MLTKMIMFLALLWAPGVAMAAPNTEPGQIESQCTNADQTIVELAVDDSVPMAAHQRTGSPMPSEQKPHHAHCLAPTKSRTPMAAAPAERLRGKPAAPEPTTASATDRFLGASRGIYWRSGPNERWVVRA